MTVRFIATKGDAKEDIAKGDAKGEGGKGGKGDIAEWRELKGGKGDIAKY
jgi:hypothetical protein